MAHNPADHFGDKKGRTKSDPANKRGIIAPNPVRLQDTDVLREVLQAIQLRKGGATYRNIAQNLGIAEGVARNHVVTEMERLKKEIQEEAHHHLQLQLERLNEMLLAYWPRRQDPRYGGMILAVMQKMDNLLGVGAEKIDLKVTSNEFEKMPQEELDNFIKKHMGALAAPVPVKPTVQ